MSSCYHGNMMTCGPSEMCDAQLISLPRRYTAERTVLFSIVVDYELCNSDPEHRSCMNKEDRGFRSKYLGLLIRVAYIFNIIFKNRTQKMR
jgi:hypothetical protein